MVIDKKGLAIVTFAVFCLLVASVQISRSSSNEPYPNNYGFVRDFTDTTEGIYAKILSTQVNAYSDEFPEFMVLWIMQDSGFRDSSLQLGDYLIGIEGKRFQSSGQYKIGAYDESQYWRSLGKKAGDTVSLLVRRDDDILSISGRLTSGTELARADHGVEIYPGGPGSIANGEGRFSHAWSQWYKGLIGDMALAMTGGANYSLYDSRHMFEILDAAKPRMAYLVKNHPGEWTKNLVNEWKQARNAAKGEVYELTKEDLAYRDFGKERAQDIASAGKAAEKAFLEQRGQQLMDAFPSPGAFDASREELAKKIVVLDDLVMSGNGIAVDAGQLYLVAGDTSKGFYFIEAASRGMSQVNDALYRYKRGVQYLKQEKYRIIGRIQENPRMVNINGTVVAGNLLEVIASSVSDAFFVDLTKSDGSTPMFVGEGELQHPPMTLETDSSSPKGIMHAFIDSLKYGDEETWKELFRTWDIKEQQGGIRYLETDLPVDERRMYYAWEGSRKALLGLTNNHFNDVYDIRIGRITSPHAILGGEITEEEQQVNDLLGLDDDEGLDAQGKSEKKGPLVEECEVELIRIGKFGGTYRSYIINNSRQPRFWKLQRVDGGPWKIVNPGNEI